MRSSAELSDEALAALAEATGRALIDARWRLGVAESCTGGWIAKCLTDIPGSSRWFECGYVTYSNAAKQQALQVRATTLAAHGAVSAATAEEMASGALAASGADLAVAVTGVAGRDGGTAQKPVGLVWFALARRDRAPRSEQHRLGGDRAAIRRAAVAMALQMVRAVADEAATGGRGRAGEARS